MLDREPPGCPLAASAVIKTASSLLFLAISESSETCSSLASPDEKFLSVASAGGIVLCAVFELKTINPLSHIRDKNLYYLCAAYFTTTQTVSKKAPGVRRELFLFVGHQ
jgi:hypothetical protein